MKKILGIVLIIIGIAVVMLAIYLLVVTVLTSLNKFHTENANPFGLVFGLLFLVVQWGLLLCLGIVSLKGGQLLFNYNRFSAEDIALKLIREIYTAESLKKKQIKISKSNRYSETKNIDLADIYKQVDRQKFPEVYEDLLATIKARVEARI